MRLADPSRKAATKAKQRRQCFFASMRRNNSEPPNFDVGGSTKKTLKPKHGMVSSSAAARLQPMHARRPTLLSRPFRRDPRWKRSTGSARRNMLRGVHIQYAKKSPSKNSPGGMPSTRMPCTRATIQVSMHTVLIIFHAEAASKGTVVESQW